MSIKTFGGPKSALVASLLVLSSALPFNNAALAEGAAPQPVATQQVSVGSPHIMSAAKVTNPDVIGMRAASSSNHALAVVVYGDEVKDLVINAVQTSGVPVREIITAPLKFSPTGNSFVELYANSGNHDKDANATNEWIGYLHSDPSGVPEGIKNALKIALISLNNGVVQPALVERAVANGNKKP